MRFWFNYLRTWLIIKEKQLGKKIFHPKSYDYTKFVILCAPRTGSNWLHTLLNSHPQIFSYGEVLRKGIEGNNLLKLPSLQHLVFTPHQEKIKAVGLKLFYEYSDDPVFMKSFQEVIDDKSIFIIHLTRNSLLSQYVSLKKAEKNQLWSQPGITKISNPIQLDRNDFFIYQAEYLRQKETIYSTFFEHTIFEISYEELNTETDKVLLQLQQFLQIKPRKLFSLLQKQSNRNLKQQILNWEDFEKEF